jgi:ribose/xylose/arabinose/galactoside ABC-type transport system permease subunit
MATIITPDPHFSERFSMRMITLLVWTGLLALAGGGLWWYGHSFLDTATLEALYQDAFPVLVLAGPMALVMLAGGLDLSIGSVMALASVLTATALRNGASPQDAFILVMLFAGGIGLIHALLTGLLAINSAVVTFVSAVLIHQLALVYAGDLQELPFGGPGFIESLHCSPMVLGAAAGAAMFLILLAQIGGQAGKDPITQQKWYRRVMFISLPYVLSSMAAGVVGSTQAAAVSEGSTNPKQTTVLMVIFAALVGGNCSGRRFGTVIGAVAGAAILVVLEYYLRIMEAMKSEMAMMIIASAAGAGLLLSHLTYCLINRLYRKSRQKAEA